MKATSRPPDLTELLLSLSCHRHRKVGKTGTCQATGCLIRQAGNIEGYVGECRLYERLSFPKETINEKSELGT